MKKYPLNVVFGSEACDVWDEDGFHQAKEKIDKGKIDGSASTYLFDTERDRRLAIELIQEQDGWSNSAYDTNTLSWIRKGAKCRWNDPGISDYPFDERKMVLNRVFIIVEVKKELDFACENDDIILIKEVNGPSEAEVLASELVPVGEPEEKTMEEKKIHNIVASGILSTYMNHIRREYMLAIVGKMIPDEEISRLFIDIENAMRDRAEQMLLDYKHEKENDLPW